jgi:uncharacterized protein (TIGR03000 family)
MTTPFAKNATLLLLALGSVLAALNGGEARAAEPGRGTIALVAVRVPPDAELWFEGSKMAQAGNIRVFRTPPLEPGKLYTYDVRVRWQVGEQEETRTRTVLLSAGETIGVDFTGPFWVAAPRPQPTTALAKAR